MNLSVKPTFLASRPFRRSVRSFGSIGRGVCNRFLPLFSAELRRNFEIRGNFKNSFRAKMTPSEGPRDPCLSKTCMKNNDFWRLCGPAKRAHMDHNQGRVGMPHEVIISRMLVVMRDTAPPYWEALRRLGSHASYWVAIWGIGLT